MSTESIGLGGLNQKEWSLIILIGGLATVFIVFAIGMVVAVSNNPEVVIKGEIDLGQFTGVIIGIAMVAVVLVSQQLTSRSQAAAVASTDSVWLESEKINKGES